MNREQRRSKFPGPITRYGIKLARRAGWRINIHSLIKTDFNKESLAKYNKRIKSDPEYRDPEALTNDAISILLSSPGDNFYPEIKRKDNTLLTALGVRPQRNYYRNLIRAIMQLVQDVKSSVRLATQTGTLKGTPIYDKASQSISHGIANRYGYHKGRQRNPDKRGDDNSQAGFTDRESSLDTKLQNYAVPDDTDRIENELLHQQLLVILKTINSADKLCIRTQLLANEESISFETAYCRNKETFAQLGINSARAAFKRLRYMPTKYPELKVIRESLKK